MKLLTLAAVPLCLSGLPAQQPRVDPTLPEFRTAFEGGPAVQIAIGFVGDAEPVILCSGEDAKGQPVTPLSLLPLQALAKVLAADALHQQLRGKLDQGSGVTLGDRELPVRELLEGTPLLPDYFVADGGPGPVDAAILIFCGEVAAGSKSSFYASTWGAAEFTVLENMIPGRRGDWPTALRTELAAHVPGLDPFAADVLAEGERARLPLPDEETAVVAAAQPSLYRVLISAKNLGAWWQWRVQQDLPLWSGPRMGRTGSIPPGEGQSRWWFTTIGPSFTISANIYPASKAGFVYFGPARPSRTTAVQRGFEADLFGAREGGRAQALAGGVFAVAAAPVARDPAADALLGTRWRTATAADGAVAWRLHFESAKRDGVVVEQNGVPRRSTLFQRSAEGWTVTTAADGEGVTLRLSLWPRPEARPDKITAVVVQMRGRFAALPGIIELQPDKD